MFAISSWTLGAPKGISITFPNGYRLSIQWGVGNYCDNHHGPIEGYKGPAPDSSTAETAIIKPDGSFLEYKGDDVQGWQTPEQVAETMAYVASLPKE